MMLSSLLVRQFRLIQESHLMLQPGMQLFLGQNAQGKTSLIEAILFLSTSLSHRTRREEDLIRWGEKAAFLRGEIENDGRAVLECGLEKNRKLIKVDGAALPRVGDLYGKLRTVLFAPEDLSIVGGSPQERRRFLDMAIAQLDPQYIPLLQQFRRSLRQRNQILKRLQMRPTAAGEKELDVWDRSFLHYASEVILQRVKASKRMAPLVEEHYAGLADDGPLRLSYSAEGGEDPASILESLQEKMRRLRRSEIERGSSQFGPHRDDLHFGLAGKNLTQFGSQGQRRTAALALRLAQAQWCREGTGRWPLLLIDDVVHEMDAQRRERFWRRLDPSGQMIVTGTDREHLGAGVEPAQVFRVDRGLISRM